MSKSGRRACPSAWMLPHAGASTAGCSRLAWQPTVLEHNQCANDSLLPCTTNLWKRCLSDSKCPLKDSCHGSEHSVAWVTLLSGNALNFSFNTLLQAMSVKTFSCHPHITLVTPDVAWPIRQWITRTGATTVREVPTIKWKHAPGGVTQSYANTFSKLHVWNMTGFSQLVLLDSDAFLLHASADRIFRFCTDPDADLCAGREANRGLNSGVMVVRPSTRKFAMLLDAVSSFRHSSPMFMDQNFFNRHYNAAGWKPDNTRGLEFFNVPTNRGSMSTRRNGHGAGRNFQSCPSFSRGAFLYNTSFRAPGVRLRIESFFIWHACGVHKLDVLPPCPPTTDASSFCASRILRLFQWLYEQANPCSTHGASARVCKARGAGACHWCGNSTRCVPSSLNCYANDKFTKALISRMQQPRGMSRIRPGWCSLTCDPTCCHNHHTRRNHRNHRPRESTPNRSRAIFHKSGGAQGVLRQNRQRHSARPANSSAPEAQQRMAIQMKSPTSTSFGERKL